MTYIDYVRSLPCARCQMPDCSDAHHIIDASLFPGMGKRAPDMLTMPLCRTCHQDTHSGWATENQYRWLVRTLDRAAKEGWDITKE